jgi:integrative and conjugative element protein (TIGR02256 family)
MGEHVSNATFRLVDFSVQHAGGSHASFERDPMRHRAQLDEFFARTGGDYSRFNYLGEWHSHPRFAPLPSPTDVATMQSIAEDPEVGVNFLVLLIARLIGRWRLELSATAFRAGHDPIPVEVSVDRTDSATPACGSWLRRLFRW